MKERTKAKKQFYVQDNIAIHVDMLTDEELDILVDILDRFLFEECR